MLLREKYTFLFQIHDSLQMKSTLFSAHQTTTNHSIIQKDQFLITFSGLMMMRHYQKSIHCSWNKQSLFQAICIFQHNISIFLHLTKFFLFQLYFKCNISYLLGFHFLFWKSIYKIDHLYEQSVLVLK